MSIGIQQFRNMVDSAKVLDGDLRLSDGEDRLVKVNFGGKFRKVVNSQARESVKDNADANEGIRGTLLSALREKGVVSPRIREMLGGDNLTKPLSRRVVKQVLDLFDAANPDYDNVTIGGARNRDFHQVGGVSMTTTQFDAMIDKAVASLGIKDSASAKTADGYVKALKKAFAQHDADGRPSELANGERVRDLAELFSRPLNDEDVQKFLSTRLAFDCFEKDIKTARYDSDYVQKCVRFNCLFNSALADVPRLVSQINDGERHLIPPLAQLKNIVTAFKRLAISGDGGAVFKPESHNKARFDEMIKRSGVYTSLTQLKAKLDRMAGQKDADDLRKEIRSMFLPRNHEASSPGVAFRILLAEIFN